MLARTLDYGWNSPVFDVLAPLYVVARAESSAPTRGNPNALSTVRYRYEGALMQAGGRGFLGFSLIWTFDDNHGLSPNQYVVTRSAYAQNYPFVGMPIETRTLAVTGPTSFGSAELEACAVDPEASGRTCFAAANATPWPNLLDDGVLVAYGGNQPLCNGPGCFTDNNARCGLDTGAPPPTVSVTNGLFTPQPTPSPLHAYVYHDFNRADPPLARLVLAARATTNTRNS